MSQTWFARTISKLYGPGPGSALGCTYYLHDLHPEYATCLRAACFVYTELLAAPTQSRTSANTDDLSR